MEEPEPIPPQPEPPPEPPTPEPAPQPEPPFPQPQPPFPHPTPPPAAAPTGPGPPPLSSGWRPALLGAVGTILVLGVAAGIGVALGYVSADTRPSPVATARLVGLVFFAFHHVGVHTSIAGGPSGFPVHGTITLAFAMLTGTVIALWLLARTGRAIAEHVGGTAVVRGLHGAKVALPYAVIVFAVSWLVRFEGGELTGEGVHASFRVSPLAAFLWPLGLAAVAGFVGGVRSPQGRVWLASRLGSWPTGVVTGGGAMLAIGLGLAFVGLVLLAPVHPDATSAYFGPFKDSVATGLAVVYVTLLFVPNMAAWVLLPSMGSCLTASGSAIGLSGSFCFLSYTQFPSSNVATTGRVPPDLPGPPAGYFLFLLAPLVAVLVGGMIAARTGAPASRVQSVAVGAGAGVVFAFLALLTAVLATITARAAGSLTQELGGTITLHAGPDLTRSFLVALLWGVVGGALGGMWGGRSLASTSPPPAALAASPGDISP